MATRNGLAQVKQRERLVAALRPVSVAATTAAAPSLLANLRPLPYTPAGVWAHGFSRLDVSGRIRDAVVFDLLGWKSGTEVEVSLDGEHAVVRRTPGAATLDGRGRLTLGETVRRALHLDAGCGVLLSADAEAGVLLLTPARRCDMLLSA